jgi:predicted metal-dependent peptidase
VTPGPLGPAAPAESGPSRPAALPNLAPARLWAARVFPYLASAIFGLQATAAPGTGVVTADQRWRLRADPEVTARWSPAQLGSVLIHLACHLLRQHAERANALRLSPPDRGRWADATDAEINDDLVPAGLELPGTPVLPGDFGAPSGRLAEEYFELLLQPPPEEGGEGGSEAVATDRYRPDMHCCSEADAASQAGDDGDGGLDGWQADLLRRQVAQEVIRHAQEAGAVPAGLRRWAAQAVAPKADWRRLLAGELRRAVADVAGAVDYSYRRPARRATPGVVLPALRRPAPHVAVICDTSGSMSDDLLAAALAEVAGVLGALGVARQVHVLACDAAAGPAQRVTSARQVRLTGGGGTDMGAGIAAAGKLRPRPAVTVVLTDGYTAWPAQAPKGMRVVAGLLGQDARDAPGWARSVRIALGGLPINSGQPLLAGDLRHWREQ